MRRYLGALLLLAATTAAGAASGSRWIHIRVDDHGERDSSVDVQVPLSMVSAILPTLKTRVDLHALSVNGNDMSWAEARDTWRAVKNSQDGEYVTVKDAGDLVRVSKKGGFLLVYVNERDGRGAKVRVRMPESLVDAVLARGDAIDLDAIARSLDDLPDGDVVLVDDEDSHVRIWIDGRAAASRGEGR